MVPWITTPALRFADQADAILERDVLGVAAVGDEDGIAGMGGIDRSLDRHARKHVEAVGELEQLDPGQRVGAVGPEIVPEATPPAADTPDVS
jgi:hypothetical protein